MDEQGLKFIEDCKTACGDLELWLGRCDEAEIKAYFRSFVAIRRYLHEVISEAEKIVRRDNPGEEDETR